MFVMANDRVWATLTVSLAYNAIVSNGTISLPSHLTTPYMHTCNMLSSPVYSQILAGAVYHVGLYIHLGLTFRPIRMLNFIPSAVFSSFSILG